MLLIIISHIGLVSTVQIAVIGSDISLIAAIQISIVSWCHISTTSPVFISNTEIIHLPGFLSAVFSTQGCHRRYPVESHVLYPLGHLLYGTASHIAIDVGLTTDLFTQFEELMGTEAVVLGHTTPMSVDHFLAVLLRSDTVLPVVFVCETATGPAQHRKLHLLECCHYIVTHTIGIGNLGILSHIQSFIDTSAQMLGKVTVEFRVDMSLLVFFVNIHLCHINLPSSEHLLLKALHFMPVLRRLRTFFYLYIFIYYTS